MKKSQLRQIIKEEISKVFNEADYKYKNYVASAFDKINDAMFEFRHSMGLKQLTNKDMKLKDKVESIHQAIFDLQREMRNDGLTEADSYDRFDDDEGEPSVFLVDELVTDSLYDIHEIIKFIDNDLNDNDLGGDLAKPVLKSVATQLNDLHDELLEITDEGDRLITPYR